MWSGGCALCRIVLNPEHDKISAWHYNQEVSMRIVYEVSFMRRNIYATRRFLAEEFDSAVEFMNRVGGTMRSVKEKVRVYIPTC